MSKSILPKPNPETDKFLLQIFDSEGNLMDEVFLSEPKIPLFYLLTLRYQFQLYQIIYSSSFANCHEFIPYIGKIGFK